MEEIKEAAENYADDMIGKGEKDDMHWQAVNRDFAAGATWKAERENAELTRANARIDELEKEAEALREKCKLYYHFRGKPLDAS